MSATARHRHGKALISIQFSAKGPDVGGNGDLFDQSDDHRRADLFSRGRRRRHRIIGRDSIPAPRLELASASVSAVQAPVSNREDKKDRLAVVELRAGRRPSRRQIDPALSEPLRQAYASTSPADLGHAEGDCGTRCAAPAIGARCCRRSQRPSSTKPQPQKNYALLSDIQIAGIKERLKLSASQESYWPPVETALRAVARKIHAGRQANPNAAGVPIDPEAEEVQQLKSAAMPLLFQLREDQKSEVRSLARIIGLEKVASMI